MSLTILPSIFAGLILVGAVAAMEIALYLLLTTNWRRVVESELTFTIYTFVVVILAPLGILLTAAIYAAIGR